jgi:hypothetical protein
MDGEEGVWCGRGEGVWGDGYGDGAPHDRGGGGGWGVHIGEGVGGVGGGECGGKGVGVGWGTAKQVHVCVCEGMPPIAMVRGPTLGVIETPTPLQWKNRCLQDAHLF